LLLNAGSKGSLNCNPQKAWINSLVFKFHEMHLEFHIQVKLAINYLFV